ncbi:MULTISPECIES: MarR family transcriptional regulator [Brevibacillus]|uniref:MarR family winged helix-turn-helix transcriptional regulator n=1 Tax=Brevibacillus TaxID=55080 RepID=UPI002041E1E8|nr:MULTISPECIES: MarR family transcriptional regulator [Brevibacillus]MCM3080208.1 MarR family transcriptional regulator [Brevibacillus invocatus]MCM3430346.1 MarR family transcriptional regulator [Brevibacillus invocatus]MDH4619603.1 MarR family transcriptional regulator [Brevibacillus sp. AY1]
MKLDDALGFAINNTGRSMSRILTSAFHSYEVTPEQWSILKRLEEEDRITIKELSKRVGKDQANVTRISDLLDRKGFIQKISNPEDKRSSLVCLTEEGHSIVRQLDPIDERVNDIALQDLTENEIELLKKLLAKIRENINAELHG